MGIKPEKGDKRIQVYCSYTFLKYIKNECKKRDNVSMSALFKIAIYDYLNPRVATISEEIVSVRKIDRTPKKITPREKINMGIVNQEFRQKFLNKNIKDILKPPPADKIHHIYNLFTTNKYNEQIISE